MSTTQPPTSRRLELAYTACFAVAGWAAIAAAGFAADRGLNRSNMVHTGTVIAAAIFTVVGLIVLAVKIRRRAVAKRNMTRNFRPAQDTHSGPELAPVATVPAGRNQTGRPA